MHKTNIAVVTAISSNPSDTPTYVLIDASVDNQRCSSDTSEVYGLWEALSYFLDEVVCVNVVFKSFGSLLSR